MKTEIPNAALDVGATNKYLASVESMAREARQSGDPRVKQLALAVLGRQGPAIDNTRRAEALNQ